MLRKSVLDSLRFVFGNAQFGDLSLQHEADRTGFGKKRGRGGCLQNRDEDIERARRPGA
nr:hypothetical protein SHINE37_20042 [Rhizobiaceae bacterium]